MIKRATIAKVATVALAVAVLAPQAFAQTWDSEHLRSLIFAGGGNDLFHTLTIQAPALGGSSTLTLPGSNIAGILKNDGTGNLTWATILPLAYGGTNGTASPTAGAVAYGTGTAYAFNTAGTSGSVLKSGGSGAPTFSSSVSGLTITNSSIGSSSPSTGAFTTLTSNAATTLATGPNLTNAFGTGTASANTIGEATGTNLINGATTIGGTLSMGSNQLSGSNFIITGGSINATPIGATTASTGSFTTTGSGPTLTATSTGVNGTNTALSLSATSGTNNIALDVTAGDIQVAGNLYSVTNGGGTMTSDGLLTASNGFTMTAGSASFGSNNVAGSNFTITGIGGSTISGTAISGSTGSFTTLSSGGASTIGTGSSLTNSFGAGSSAINTFGNATGTNAINGTNTIGGNSTFNGTAAHAAHQVTGSNFVLSGGTIDNMVIGGTTPVAGTFTGVTMKNGAARTLQVAQEAASTAGDVLNIAAGAAGITTANNGGNLVLASGAKTTTGLDGDILLKTGGTAGTTQLTVNHAGGVTVNTGALNVNSGGITNAGSIAGATTISSTGAYTSGDATHQGSLVLFDNEGAANHAITIQTPTTVVTETYTLPNAGGAANFAITSATPTNNALPKWNSTAGLITNSSITDDATTVSTTEGISTTSGSLTSGDATHLGGLVLFDNEGASNHALTFQAATTVATGTYTWPSVAVGAVSSNSSGTITLGTLSVGNGGTGQTTLIAHGVVIGNAATAVNVTAAGTAGQVLTSGGAAADPGWTSQLAYANGANNGSAATAATTGTMTVNMTTAVITITPSGTCTFNASGGLTGQLATFVITTSGTSSFTLTWGTNFKTTATLATGSTTAKVFCVTFRCINGTSWYEIDRTAAM